MISSATYKSIHLIMIKDLKKKKKKPPEMTKFP